MRALALPFLTRVPPGTHPKGQAEQANTSLRQVVNLELDKQKFLQIPLLSTVFLYLPSNHPGIRARELIY